MSVSIEVRLFNKVDGNKRSLAPYKGRAADFLADVLVGVTDAASETSPISPLAPTRKFGKTGATPFDLPAGTKVFDLKVTFFYLSIRVSTNLLRIAQRFRITAKDTLEPLEPPQGLRPWVDNDNLHPRLVPEKLTVWIDATFLDMTMSSMSASKGPHKVDRHLYEYTAGTPTAWVVSIPEHTWPTNVRSKLGVILFFRPAMTKDYKNAEDVKLTPVERYLDDPSDPKVPWFLHPKGFKGVATAVHAYPNCALERQIAEGKLPDARHVILVHPVPHQSGYGDAITPRIASLLESLLRAIWATSAPIMAGATRLELGKIAVAGFSSGGPSALDAFNAIQSRVNDLYLFDPEQFPSMVKTLEPWIKGGRDRKLRMIGALRLDAMLGFARVLARTRLPSGNEATVWPSGAAFWESSAWTGLMTSADPDDLLSPPGALPPTDTSIVSGIFLAGAGRSGATARLQAKRVDGSSIGEREVACTPAEAQFHVRFFVGPSIEFRTGPFKQVEDSGNDHRWRALPAQLVSKARDARHQWTIMGGTGNLDRGPKFEGYLKMCIDGSKFE